MDGLDDELDVLDRASCLDLLCTVPVGRLAWADDSGRIQVRPVNFGLDADDVLVRCREGSMLTAIRDGRPISFEADRLEPALRSGWSVLVVCTSAEIASDPGAGVDAGLVEPWAGGVRPCLVRLRADAISGRRLRLAAGDVSVVRLSPEESAG